MINYFNTLLTIKLELQECIHVYLKICSYQAHMNEKRKFIVIEGIDRSGKSTLCQGLVQKLKNSAVNSNPVLINYPDRTTAIGKLVNLYLKKELTFNKETSHLLFSANRWEKNEEVKRLLQDHIVICDRYFYSGIAYSIALGTDEKWAHEPDKGLVEPDILVFLDVPPYRTSTRKDFGDEIYDNLDIQEKIYLQLKKCCTESKNCVVVNGQKGIDEIIDEVYGLIKRVI
ncbi:Thymidylate kinase/adenylate kinase [Trachipleistophora hominis]|uniref:dTMP kinase n=1 Tax=Trachipleistophora hominis TaxID=72359 RepID=L7JZW7_TRAHO|nr:Thymidylate kinase/adenylate kinase [Trachipleistophora hominis]